jgi:hypothetical protein
LVSVVSVMSVVAGGTKKQPVGQGGQVAGV